MHDPLKKAVIKHTIFESPEPDSYGVSGDELSSISHRGSFFRIEQCSSVICFQRWCNLIVESTP